MTVGESALRPSWLERQARLSTASRVAIVASGRLQLGAPGAVAAICLIPPGVYWCSIPERMRDVRSSDV